MSKSFEEKRTDIDYLLEKALSWWKELDDFEKEDYILKQYIKINEIEENEIEF